MFDALIFIIFLCWGSFLNVIGYRLIHNLSLSEPRSKCPSCKKAIAWYDLIPLISWVILKGRCRQCASPISYLYPFIEFFTTVSLFTLYQIYTPPLLISYFIFFSLLIISIRTDFETMLISQYVTLGALPIGFLATYFKFLPIIIHESLLGAFLGYALLWGIAYLFKKFTNKNGLGIGDMELMAMIGSFTGPLGVWIALTIGSLLGTFFGFILIIMKKLKRNSRIPFGPFLAAGAIIYVLLYNDIIKIIAI